MRRTYVNVYNLRITTYYLLPDMSEHAAHGQHTSEWITISTDEYESMQRTIEVLSDKDLMAQIDEGKRKDAPTRDFKELAKELGI